MVKQRHSIHCKILSIFFRKNQSLSFIEKVLELRSQGIELYYTQDAGHHIKVLFLHHGAELYGSDVTFYSLIKEVNKIDGYDVMVALPSKGPLFDLFISIGIEPHIFDLAKISRSSIRPKNFGRLIYTILKNITRYGNNKDIAQCDLVYTNTLSILDGIIIKKLFNIKHIWHVHELIEGPGLVNFVFEEVLLMK